MRWQDTFWTMRQPVQIAALVVQVDRLRFYYSKFRARVMANGEQQSRVAMKASLRIAALQLVYTRAVAATPIGMLYS